MTSQVEEQAATLTSPAPDVLAPPAVAFDHVSFAFDDHVILDDISFVVPKGSMKIVLGPSGDAAKPYSGG